MNTDRQRSHDQRLDGRTALVTGAGRNLGRAIALALADGGASVMIGVREDLAAGKAVAAEIEAMGAKSAVSAGELADAAYCRRLVNDTEVELGPVDIIVHAAAIRPHRAFLDISEDDWNAVMAINCSAAFHMTQAALPSMVERGFGRVIALGGTAPGHAGLKHSHISVSKAGVEALVKEIALEFGRYGITANVVSPGPMNTTRRSTSKPITRESLERLPVPRLGEPEEIGYACRFLASEAASYITGQTLRVSGGLEL